MSRRDEVAEHFRWQADWCRRLGSPLYGDLLGRLAAEINLALPVLAGDRANPRSSFVALRFMGAVHRIVLDGRAPELAAFYPSAGGDARRAGAWDAFRSVITEHRDALTSLARRPVQTNEVGRSAALVCGFLTIARRARLPLRVLELGTSAGLNLRWDHFFYEARGETWGDPDSPVRLCDFNSDVSLPFDTDAEVVERSGCDAAVVDPTTEDGRLALMSYVWPDQLERYRRLGAAIQVARRVPARVQEADAADWLAPELRRRGDGHATVVFHSIFWPYVGDRTRSRIENAISSAGERAHAGRVVAWLRMEPDGEEASVRVRMWPGGEDREVARSGYHGAGVRWLGS
jgi:hypothetical protein